MEAFSYISCDVPEGMDLQEWRLTLPHKPSAWKRVRRACRLSRIARLS
jgi:hypothetical protein